MTVNTPKTNSTPHIKAPLEEVSGVLLFNKPFGLSSNTALQRARHLLRAKKAGHTGTLDPHATGLLPLCLGEATKFSQWILDAPKGYIATIKLGYVSDTLDGEGHIVQQAAPPSDRELIDRVLLTFVGPQQQTPPMHAAIKLHGKPLYSYARSGQTVHREARNIEIFSCTILSLVEEVLTIECLVSKGTYIRVLASDIGMKLGCGGYLMALERVSTGPYSLDNSIGLEDLMELDEVQRRACLLPVDSLLSGLPSLVVEDKMAQDITHGRSARLAQSTGGSAGLYRIYTTLNQFLGLCELTQEHVLRPIRLMATAS
ncbi:tRNA pseudouridine synthase B [Ferrovum sp. JA12]|uniref:tRNA pseudouridine(55) synthase TruB n=1 Tax=Ferrovum sp. JA12 TaxID=1356299 RepID=UPI000702E63F|nr:tRNA pseudouridine(55) synthase TruB [Ferrovum sp. JA12]KRH78099.1 tRNA pseudouridine synthase B [Ferrovum sp. JA12]